MAWLNPIPVWAWLLALLLVAGGQQLRVSWAQADAAGARAELADYRLEVQERDRRADARDRTEEQRRQAALDEVEKDGQKELEGVRARADTAERDVDGLRREIHRLRAGRAATCGAITAQQRQAGESATGVLADLLDEFVRRNRILAAAADASRVAGLACEASYDRVRGG